MDDDGEDGDKILLAMFMMKKKMKTKQRLYNMYITISIQKYDLYYYLISHKPSKIHINCTNKCLKKSHKLHSLPLWHPLCLDIIITGPSGPVSGGHIQRSWERPRAAVTAV